MSLTFDTASIHCTDEYHCQCNSGHAHVQSGLPLMIISILLIFCKLYTQVSVMLEKLTAGLQDNDVLISATRLMTVLLGNSYLHHLIIPSVSSIHTPTFTEAIQILPLNIIVSLT